MKHQFAILTLLLIGTQGCSNATSPTTVDVATPTTVTTAPAPTTGLQAFYQQFRSSVAVAAEGANVLLRSNGTPDHRSPYWGPTNTNYEAPHAGMVVNPNLIVAQTLTLRVPSSPTVASIGTDTPMGPIGMAVNGVALFNQYAAGRQPLTSEIATFDRYNGHPQQQGQYHYHLEPLWLTSGNGPSGLVGVLLDGFPVYGPRERDGSSPTGLDSCNGHAHGTADVPAGIYHYHTTATPPYISGCYRGAAGSVG